MTRSAVRRRGVGGARGRAEDGFILLESLIAISLIAVVMGALASMTLNVLTGTNELRARQGAAQLATSAMATLGALPASDLLTRRDEASVIDQRDRASARVRPWLESMEPAYDRTPGLPAGSGATATVPTAPATQTLNGVRYQVATYVGRCVMLDGACERPANSATTGTAHLRAVVAITWSGRGCRVATCTYVTATIVNDAPDPIFNTNRALPPSRPVVTDPGPQVSTRGSSVSVRFAVDAGTGLAPLVWSVTSGTLPVGLTLAADGLVSGTPTTTAAATPVTVMVSDAFGRTDTQDLTWRVVDPPSITTPPDQSTAVGQAVNLATAFTCPNAPCTVTLAGAPAGLDINPTTGVISGRPTTAGTSGSVTVTVTDAAGVPATTSGLTWQVRQSGSIASPGTQRATVGTTLSVPIAYTCGAGPCTVTLSGRPTGIGLSTTTPVSGNNATTSVSVPTGSGTVYLAGTVQPSAVPGGSTSQAYAPALRLTGNGADVTSAPGAWTVFARPGVGAPGTRTVTVGSTRSVDLPYTCPHSTCTITVTNPVPGLGLSTVAGRTSNSTTSLTVSEANGTVYLSGVVSSTAVPTGTSRAYPISVTITDASSAATTTTGTWTATTAPRISNPGSQAAEPGQDLSLQLSAECPNGGCTWRAEAQQSGSSTWFAIPISATGRITYPDVPAGSYSVRVTVTDSDGIADTATFSLTVATFTLSVPNLISDGPRGNGTVSYAYDVGALVRPLADGYTYSLSGQPSWLTIGPDGILRATMTRDSRSDDTITVTVTSTASSTSTVIDSFGWTIR